LRGATVREAEAASFRPRGAGLTVLAHGMPSARVRRRGAQRAVPPRPPTWSDDRLAVRACARGQSTAPGADHRAPMPGSPLPQQAVRAGRRWPCASDARAGAQQRRWRVDVSAAPMSTP
jgi:hypothetical protein